MPNPLNILLIFTDQHQQKTMGVYGHPVVRTPRLDALAEQGVLFTNAIVAQPVCTPARASLLTGMYGHTHRCIRNNMVLPTEFPTAAEILKEHGYRCGYIGKWHIGNETIPQRGFEEFYRSTEDNYMSARHRLYRGLYSDYDRFLRENGFEPESDSPASFFTRPEACRAPEKFGKPAFTAREADAFFSTLDDRPFFLTINFLEPHPPYFSPFDDMYSPDDIELPENYDVDETEMAGWSRRHACFRKFYYEQGHNVCTGDVDDLKGVIARYYGLCTLMDKYVGAILDSIEAHGLAEKTLVVFTSDHGDMLGSHQMVDKGMMFDEAIKVPFVIRHPTETFAKRRCDEVIDNVNVVLTILDIVGVPVPEHIEGRSFLPVLRGEPTDFPEFGVVEWNEQLQNMHARDPIFEPVLNAHVRCIVTKRWKLVLSPGDKPELYDLEADPLEQRNVFGKPEHRDTVDMLYACLLKGQHETHDPLEVPYPE